MDLISGVSGIVGNLGGVAPKNVPPQRIGQRSYVQVHDGDAAYDTAAEVYALIGAAAHADFLKIWQLTVPAQRLMRWGYGSAALQHNQGYMWFCFLDVAADFDVGILRLVQANARETKIIVVAEIPDQSLHGTDVTTLVTATPTNINEMIPLPEKVEYPFIGEDSLLILTYALITAATAHDGGNFQIPVTIYE